MAFSYQALYRVRATTEGTGELRAMERDLSRIGPAASRSAGGVSVLGRALGDVGKIAAGIGLADLGGRMLEFARSSVVAGDEALRSATAIKTLGDEYGETTKLTRLAAEYAEKFKVSQNDANQIFAQAYGKLKPLNIETEKLNLMLNSATQAARRMGLHQRDVNEVMRQFAQAMGAGRFHGENLMTMMERMPVLGEAFARAFNNIAKSKGLQQITKEQGDALIKEVQEGEKGQIRALEDGIEKRQDAVEKETDNKLREINKRYDAELRNLNNALDEQQRLRDKKAEKELDAEMRKLQRKYDAQRRALGREREDIDRTQGFEPVAGQPGMYQRFTGRRQVGAAGFMVDTFEYINEEQKRALERRIEDERIAQDQAIDDREQKEREALQERKDNEKRQRDNAAKEELAKREEVIKQRQQTEEKTIRESLDRQKKEFARQLEDQLQMNKAANQKMIEDIKARIIVTSGEIYKLGSEGRITPEIAKRAFGPELQELSKNFPQATSLDRLNTAMTDLKSTIGTNLLDGIKPIVPGTETLVKSFAKLDDTIQKLIIAIGVAGVVGAGAQALRAGGGALLGRLRGGAPLPGPVAGGGLPPALGGGPKFAPRTYDPFTGALKPTGQAAQAPAGQMGPGTMRGGRFVRTPTGTGPINAAPWQVGPRAAPPPPPVGPAPAWQVGPGRAGQPLPGQRLLGPLQTRLNMNPLPVQGRLNFPAQAPTSVARAFGAPPPPPPAPVFQQPLPRPAAPAAPPLRLPPGGTGAGAGGTGAGAGGLAGLGRGPGALGRGAGVVGAAVGAGMIVKDMASPEFWRPFGQLGQRIIETDMKIAKAVLDDLQKKANALLFLIDKIPGVTLKASAATGELGNSFTRSATVGKEQYSGLIGFIGQQSDGLAARVEPAFQEMAAGITRQLAAASDGLKNQIGFESKVWDEFFTGIYDSFGASLDAKVAQIKEKGLGETLKNDFEFESKVWDEFFLGLYEDFGKGLEDKVKQLGKAMGDGLSNALSGLRSIANGMLSIVESAVNAAANIINARIRDANNVLQQLKIPWQIGFSAPTVQLPRFARGGWVDRATVAQIGEGGDPGGEYAIPAAKMPAAIQAWQEGRRGNALVAAMQSRGLAPGSSIVGGGGGGGGATGGNLTINVPPAQIRIGQSLRIGDEDYVTTGDLEATLAERDRQWVSLVTSPQMRARLGR